MTDHPVAWREVYVEPGSGSGLLRVCLSFIVVAVVVFSFFNIVFSTLISPPRYSYYDHDTWRYFQMRTKAWVCTVTGALGSLMLLGATVRGAASVAGEKDRDTWANLLTTPLSTREILWGKWWGCVWGQRRSIYLLGGVWAIGVVTFSVNPMALALVAVALAVYLTAFAWLGVSCSVTARNSRSAITRAVPQAIFFGGGFWLLLSCCCVAGASGGGDAPRIASAFVAGFTPPAVLGLVPAVDLKLINDVFESSGFLSDFFQTTAMSAGCGCVCGTVAWFAGAMAWKRRAHELMELEANRRWYDSPAPGGPPRDRPLNLGNVPPLPRGDDSSDSAHRGTGPESA